MRSIIDNFFHNLNNTAAIAFSLTWSYLSEILHCPMSGHVSSASSYLLYPLYYLKYRLERCWN